MRIVAFVATTNLDRARTFYGDVVGLALVEESPFACVFDGGGAPLRVTVAGSVQPAPYTVAGWSVDDIGATVEMLAARGVELVRYNGMDQDATGVWTAPGGARVAWFRDPDGNVLSVTQSP